MQNLRFRRANAEDLGAIMALQDSSFIDNLSPEQRRSGFLSAKFSEQQMAAIAADLGIAVACESGDVVGFVCAFRPSFDHRSPVIARMIEQLDRCSFQGTQLSSYRTFLYGPACVAAAWRGRGVLRGLFATLQKQVAGSFEVGAAFVADDNPYSLRAHVGGLGMSPVGRFEARGKQYTLLAFRVGGSGAGRPA